jgi:hypothetical protein
LLDTTLLEVAKAKLDEEKKAIAEAKETGWEPQAGLIKTEAAISALIILPGTMRSLRSFQNLKRPHWLGLRRASLGTSAAMESHLLCQ